MARTTVDLVKEIINTSLEDSVIEGIIDSATLMVTNTLGGSDLERLRSQTSNGG